MKEFQPLAGKQAQLFPTDICDLKCKGCPYPDLNKSEKEGLKSKELNPSKWIEISDYLYANGVRFFCIIGGEPASYKGVAEIIGGINRHPDTITLLSTSGIHILRDEELRRSIGENLKSRGGIAVSYDWLEFLGGSSISQSRIAKAKEGFKFVKKMQEEFPGVIFAANVMVSPNNWDQILIIQKYLEQNNIYTNLCTYQRKCFGETTPTFSINEQDYLRTVAERLIFLKLFGHKVVNSANYLSHLGDTIAEEEYHCWDEPNGNPVLDIGSDGLVRFCNWCGQFSIGQQPGMPIDNFMDGTTSWDLFWSESKKLTSQKCPGCSWSRRDRQLPPMVSFYENVCNKPGMPDFDPNDIRMQNLWVQKLAELD